TRVEYATLRAIRQLPADDALPWWRAWLGGPVPALAALAVVTVVAIRVLQAPPVVYEQVLGKDRPSVPVASAPQRPRTRLASRRRMSSPSSRCCATSRRCGTSTPSRRPRSTTRPTRRPPSAGTTDDSTRGSLGVLRGLHRGRGRSGRTAWMGFPQPRRAGAG